MTEANQMPAEEQTAEAAIPQPETVDDSVFDDLYHQATGIGEAREEAPQEPQVQQSREAPVAEPSEDSQALRERVAQLEGVLGQMAQQGNAQGNQQQAPQDIEQEILAANKDLDPAAVKFLVDTAGKIADDKLKQAVMPMAKELYGLKQAVSQNANEKTVTDFNASMDSLAQQAGVTDPFMQGLLRDAVTSRGMQRYGNDFNVDHAKALFREVNNERLRTGHQQDTQYVQEKQSNEQSSPPVQHGVSGQSAVESFQDQLRDPNRKDMDFKSENFQDSVKNFLAAGDRAINKAMGGGRSDQ
tara:strand:+ start:5453 stop:6352 length:900 start_codon:yes stop_codon:yes gene_type:complete